MHDTIHLFACSPSFIADGICFAARDFGLYKSGDGGRTWHSAYERLQLARPLPTTSVLVSPEFAVDRRVYVGVHGGILCSPDGGATWQPATVPEQLLPTCFAVSPAFAVDNTLFVGTLEHGVLRSGDRGSYWEAWNFGLLDRSVFALVVSPGYGSDRTVFVGTESGLFRSTNGGRAWRELFLPCETEAVLSLAISSSYQLDGTLLAGTESAGLFASNDRGNTWVEVGNFSDAAINAILIDNTYSADRSIAVLYGGALHCRTLENMQWHTWDDKALTGRQITALAAPAGLARGATLLAGVDGDSILAAFDLSPETSRAIC